MKTLKSGSGVVASFNLREVVAADFSQRFLRNLKVATTIYFLLAAHCLFGEGFKIEQGRPRIITPASSPDMNDILIVPYDNPNDSNISGRILTINGSYIADMLNNVLTDRITWDGKDGSSVVPSGIYIYQIETEGQVFNGTVVVAK